ncbi:hypothetical protein N8457_00435, partial [bacterium]|nr:hypothetical protein [bacterium]
MKTMSKIYEVNATETASGFFSVEAESPAEAAFLIENGYAYYESISNSMSDVEYEIDEMVEEESGHEVYDHDDYLAFQKAYNDGRRFHEEQGQLDLDDGQAAWNEQHLFALQFAREETGFGL